MEASSIHNEVKVKDADLNFDFSFVAERDAHLIAKDFLKQLSEEDVRFKVCLLRLFNLGDEKVLVSTLPFVLKVK
jgi:hypothetical protein